MQKLTDYDILNYSYCNKSTRTIDRTLSLLLAPIFGAGWLNEIAMLLIKQLDTYIKCGGLENER